VAALQQSQQPLQVLDVAHLAWRLQVACDLDAAIQSYEQVRMSSTAVSTAHTCSVHILCTTHSCASLASLHWTPGASQLKAQGWNSSAGSMPLLRAISFATIMTPPTAAASAGSRLRHACCTLSACIIIALHLCLCCRSKQRCCQPGMGLTWWRMLAVWGWI